MVGGACLFFLNMGGGRWAWLRPTGRSIHLLSSYFLLLYFLIFLFSAFIIIVISFLSLLKVLDNHFNFLFSFCSCFYFSSLVSSTSIFSLIVVFIFICFLIMTGYMISLIVHEASRSIRLYVTKERFSLAVSRICDHVCVNDCQKPDASSSKCTQDTRVTNTVRKHRHKQTTTIFMCKPSPPPRNASTKKKKKKKSSSTDQR